MFSRRVPTDLEPNRLALALDQARSQGRRIIDLTQSNPTRAGFDYPPDLLQPLADPRALVYAPQAFGSLDARTAVSADYLRRGFSIPPSQIVLTASTSEAYSVLFKVLCDPGDEVLVPRPSYPLFEHLARLDGIVAVPYDLSYHGTWSLDIASVERGLASPKAKALLIVSPNNPTGSFIRADELDGLVALCRPREIPIVADEVFADYELVPGIAEASGHVLSRDDVLAFSLGGLSKSVGLPQAKLAWIAVRGPRSSVDAALSRIDLVCDTYLSVSTPVQVAASQLLARGAAVRASIQARLAANYWHLGAQVERSPACRLLKAEGGWSAILQVPSLGSEEDLVVSLVADDGVLIHPGYFFDFPSESYLIASLLTPELEFQDGVARILQRFTSAAVAS